MIVWSVTKDSTVVDEGEDREVLIYYYLAT